jgi:peptide/nickel transport system substrate-binding protein
VVLPADIKSIDQAVDESFNAANIRFQVFDRLIGLDQNMRFVPMLATSWKRVDPVTWRFTLRRDVKFQDGEPFNADAVKATIERAGGPKSVVDYAVSDVKTVNVVDPYTVDIVSKTPDPLLANNYIWLDMWPPKAAATLGDQFGSKPVGSGPYAFGEWTPGERVVLKANPDYWGAKPRLDEITFRFVTEPSTRVAMLQRGEADLITNVDPELVPVLSKGQRAKVTTTLSGRKMLVILNPSVKPLADVRVRQALNYAVDKASIIKYVLGGFAEPAPGVIFRVQPGFDPSLKGYPYDPAKAKELLAAAGNPNGFSVDLYHTVGTFPKDKETAQAIADELGKVGVRVTLQPIEWTTFYTRLKSKDLPGLMLMRYALFQDDPVELYKWALWSKGVQVYFSSPQLDQMIAQSDAELDPSKRDRLFPAMERYASQSLVPWVFLYDLKSIYGLSKQLNWSPNAYEAMDLRGAFVAP